MEQTIENIIGEEAALTEIYWAWGVMKSQDRNIHAFIHNDDGSLTDEGGRFIDAIDDLIRYDRVVQRHDGISKCLYGQPRNFYEADLREGAIITGGNGGDVVAKEITEFFVRHPNPMLTEQEQEEHNAPCGPHRDEYGQNLHRWWVNYEYVETTYPGSDYIEAFIVQSLTGRADSILDAENLEDASCPPEAFSIKPRFCKAGFGEHGGFVLEKFIKITDKTFDPTVVRGERCDPGVPCTEWGIILDELRAARGDRVANLAEDLIKSRDPNLFGVVNLQAWADWTYSLFESGEELGLFITPAG